MTVATLNLRWVHPGPIAADYVACEDPACVIIGPVGSAKTSASFRKLVRNALFIQEPHPVDGWVRVKFITVRQTYRQLEDTTIPTWQSWYPPDLGTFTGGSGGRPATHEIRFDLQGRKIHLLMEFRGVGEQTAKQFARGLEATGFYLNEADQIARDVFIELRGRLGKGRYPKRDNAVGFKGATLPQMLLDMNAPNVEDWAYQDLIENPLPGVRTFIQPSGLSPDAENLDNLAGGAAYYEELAIGQPDWWVRRMIKNEFGFSREGKPVYEEFSDHFNVAKHALEPVNELPLIVGADAGLTPAIVFCQQMPTGQWRVLDEICAFGMGAQRFGKEIDRFLDGANSRYRGIKKISAWCDPAAAARSPLRNDEQTWVDLVSESCGLRFKVAPTNAPMARLAAVQRPLLPDRWIDPDTPGLLISPTCRMLRKGFNGAYRYRKVQIANSDRYEEEPDKKDPTSHVHDALQYALMGGGEYAEATGKARRRRERLAAERGTRQPEYDPFSW